MTRKIIFKFLWIPAFGRIDRHSLLLAGMTMLLFWATPSMSAIYTGGNGAGWGYAQGNSCMYYGGNGSGESVISMGSDTTVGYSVTATQLAFSTSPSNSYAGAAFGTQPIVAVEDTYGNTVLNATNSVTLSINNDPVGSSTLGGTTSMSAVAGVANFVGLGVYVSRAGTPYALQAAASGLTSATSSTFTSSSPVQVSYPNGGQVLTVSTPYNITWNTFGSLATGTNTVQYSINNGSTWVTLSTSATSPLSWVTPSTASTQALVKVSNSADATFTNTSASTFSLLAGFTMIAPNGGEVWSNGFSHTISWSTSGTVANVKLEYSADGGSTWNTIVASTANVNQYTWTPSVASGGANYKVRVSDASNSLSNAVSASAFTVQQVNVTAPTSGQRIEAGTSTNITWSSGGISNVEIQYTTNGGSSWTTLTSSVSAAGGTYSWSVPSNFTTTTNVQVRISSTAVDSDGDTAINTSSAFTIYGALAITAPNGSEQWAAGTANNITWNTTAGTIANVELQYSADNFVSDFHTITASTSNSGTYSWTPTITGITYKVRVSDAQDSQDYSTSANYFSVTGIGVTSPASGVTWNCSSSQTITWNYTGSFSNVNIQYSTNNGSSWTTIVSSAPNTGSYSWTSVENTPSSTALISVTNSSNALTTGTSQAFNIKSVLSLTSPNGGNTLNVGASSNITWTTTGTVANVKLEYSTDNGSTWNTITASTSNTGSYSWTVPDAISSQALVRVTDIDAGHPASSAQSASEFTIQSNMAVSAPTTSNNWAVNETHNITWTDTGTVGQIRIYYATSKDSYASWTEVTSGATSNSNTYSWTLPDIILAVGNNPQTTPSLAVEIKVVDASGGHPATTAISNVFNVIYYTTTWVVQDSQSHGLLANLSVSDTSGWSASSQTSGVTHNYPYGTYTTIWSKDSYSDSSYANWVANQNQTLTVNMVLSAVAGQAYDVYSNFTYDATSSSYLINSWIEQAGAIVTNPTSCTVTIVDSNDNVVNTLSSSSVDSNGVFRQVWSLTGLNPNSSYLGKVQVVYQGSTYSANAVYSISVPSVATVAAVTSLGTQFSDFATANTTATTAIQNSVGSNLGTNVSTIGTAVGTLQTTANNISSAVGTLQTTENNVLTSVGANLTGQVSGVDSDVVGVGTNVSAIQTSVGSNLGSNVSTIGTAVGNLQTTANTISTSVGSNLGSNVSAIGTAVGSLQTTATSILNDVIAMQTDVTTAKNNIATLVSEIGTGNIAAIKTKTDTISWADVTGLVTTSGAIKAKTDTISWSDVTAIKTKTDTISWSDVTGIKTKTDTINWGDVIAINTTLSSLSTLTTTINSLLPQLSSLATTVTTINTLLGSSSNPNSLYGKLATINTNVNTLINDWGTYKASDIVNNANTVAAALGNPVDSCGLLTVFGKINCIYNQGGNIESTSALANQTYSSIQQLQQQIGSKGKSVEAYHLMQNIGVYTNGLQTSVGVIPQNTVQPELFQISQNVQAAQRTLAKTSSQAGITSVVPSQGTQVSPVTLDNLHQELLELKQMTELVKNTVVSKEGPQVKAYFENGSTGK